MPGTGENHMKKLISFRPNCVGNNTAYECMAMIYKYLQDKYGYSFTIIKAEGDRYEDPAFKIVSIPDWVWRPIPRTHFFPPSLRRSTMLRNLFAHVDGILTIEVTTYPQALLAMRTAKELGKPVWYDSSVTTMGKGESVRWKVARMLIKPLLSHVNGIIVTVPKCLERYQDIGLFGAELAPKFVMMGHPVDTSRFKPICRASADDGIIRVLVVSRLVPEKGCYYIIEALAPILGKQSDVRLQILGEGPMKGLIQKEAARRGIADQVEFLPMVNHADLPGIVGSADIFVNHAVATSGWEEFFGVVNLEAMACGLPCVISNCGGLSYVVRDNEAAVMVNERDVHGLRTGIQRFIEDKPLRREYGERARAYVVQHYDITVIGERYRQMLEEGLDVAEDRPY